MLLQLAQGIRKNLLSHAYLFLGKKNKTVKEAEEFAMAVNCLSKRENGACQECLSCLKILHCNHPDVFIFEPKGASFKIDQVRELRKKISYKHFEAKYKILILTDADLMTVEAANSLLKILEEPPHKTIFILLAENGDNILPTILSRCQIMRITGEPEEVAGEECNGEKEKTLHQIRDFVNEMSLMDDDQVLKYAEMWDKNKENIKLLFDTMTIWYRDIAIAKLTREKKMVAHENIFEEALESRVQPKAALLAVEEVQKSQRFMSQNANLRLVLEVLFLKLHRLSQRTEELHGEGCGNTV